MRGRIASRCEIFVGGLLILVGASLVAITPGLIVIGPGLILVTRGLIVIEKRPFPVGRNRGGRIDDA